MHWFILGRETLLSAAEIAAVTHHHPESISGSILKLDQPINPVIIRRLGGTIKIGEEIASELTVDELKEKMAAALAGMTGKIHFGVSIYSTRESALSIDERLGLEVKKELKKTGKSVRFVEGKHGTLNSAQIKYNKLIDKGAEFLVEVVDKKFNLARTIAVQDVDEFSARDFGRPGRDDLSGMLPPKLAMMLINLAQAAPDDVILDPFCGSGTILSEAMLMGYKNLIGADISEKAIEDTKKNIEWIHTRCHSPYNCHSERHAYRQAGSEESPIVNLKLLKNDVVKLSSILSSHSIDTIITEPYLGKPLRGNETETQIRAQAKELKKLYLSAFEQFAKILKPNGQIVFIFPRFKLKNDWARIDIKNEVKKIGFSAVPLLPQHEFLLYARPDQKVGREIWRFTR